MLVYCRCVLSISTDRSMHNTDTPQELTVAPGCLLTFADDTGHETFAGDQPYYGLGGCAVPIEHYDELKFHWRRVRAMVTGDPNTPLHATDLPRTDKAFAAVAEFFRLKLFFRFGVIGTRKTALPAHLHSAKPVMEILKKHIVAIASRTSCTSVALVFEQSQRGDPLLHEHFGVLGLEEDGKPLPVEHCIMPKADITCRYSYISLVRTAGSPCHSMVPNWPQLAPISSFCSSRG